MGAKYDQLDLDERIEMSRLYKAGTSRREIDRIIGRSASTVGRELRRNTLPRSGYKPASAASPIVAVVVAEDALAPIATHWSICVCRVESE